MLCRPSLSLALLALSCCAGGCRLFEHEPKFEYQTTPATPNRDMEVAKKEHKAASKLINHGKLDKAEKHLKKALAADVSFGPAHNSLGMLHYLRGSLYQAAWEFEYASKLMPERSEPLYNLGMVLEAAGKLEDAIAMYSSAQVLDPENPQIMGNLARARLRSGESVDDVRYLLEGVVFADVRPNWKGWAQEMLGINPSEDTAINNGTPAAERIAPPAAEPAEPELSPDMLPPPSPGLILSR